VFLSVYNNPNRDCAASASAGELRCHSPNCADGLRKYKEDYILPLRNILARHPHKVKVLFVETDSLPNSATNYENPGASPCQSFHPPRCSNTAMTAYYNGVIHALNGLHVDDNTYFYLDSAHHAWLGWAGQQELDAQRRPTAYPDPAAGGLAQLYVHNVRQILESTPQTKELSLKASRDNAITEYTVPLLGGGLQPGVARRVRGFATNIANRELLLDREDKCGLAEQYNFCPDELSFVDMMDFLWKDAGYEWGWVIDTGRNGRDGREGPVACQQWCNVASQHNPDALPQVPPPSWNRATGYVFDPETQSYRDNNATLDAFFWIKEPSSDGCSNEGCTRRDCMCVRDCDTGYQLCDAPEAGEPFEAMLNAWYPS
jgi:cellulase/cellobiase CelA1